MDDIPIGKNRAIQAGIDIIDGAVTAFSHSALHSSLQGHQDLVFRDIQLDELFEDNL
jgi:pyruvate/oxaloacetate carboxyltransferase